MLKSILFLASFILVSLVAASDEQCYCFPETDTFREQYYTLLSDDTYYAEKTFPTLAKYLANQSKHDYSIVPHYVVYDYEQYICDNIQELCTMEKVFRNYYVKYIKQALDTIAKSCRCN